MGQETSLLCNTRERLGALLETAMIPLTAASGLEAGEEKNADE